MKTTLGISEALNMDAIDVEYSKVAGDLPVGFTEKTTMTVQSDVPQLLLPAPVPANVPVKLEDSDYIRTKLKSLVDNTKDALDVALMVQEEIPFNSNNTMAIAKMADSISKCLETLMKLNKAEKDEEARAKEIETPKVVNQNLIVLSTQDLISKILEQIKYLKGK